MKNTILLIISSSLLFFSTCKQTNEDSDLNDEQEKEVLLVESFSESDDYQITSANINGDQLILNIQYSGGCKTHLWIIQAAESFLESLPVQANTMLIHDSSKDQCEAMINQEESFNLIPLKDHFTESYQTSTGTIILNLFNYQEELKYEF